jgi:hypothetical protein
MLATLKIIETVVGFESKIKLYFRLETYDLLENLGFKNRVIDSATNTIARRYINSDLLVCALKS